MSASVSHIDTTENLFYGNNNHGKQKHFVICESCFWCASSISSWSTSDPSLTQDEAISKCPLCDSDKINSIPLLPRGLQFEHI